MVNSVQVAVAVIYYNDKFLLGFRKAHQHQGNRYEFIGGKIEPNETAKSALIREVFEELGVAIDPNAIDKNTINKLGDIHHDYTDKTVTLSVFLVGFNHDQFSQLQGGIGAENQQIIWVDKASLLAGLYPLPDANQPILDWVKDKFNGD